jgi:hypothetical protein
MKKILPFLIVAILAGGISFYGGSVFAKKQSPAFPNGARANGQFQMNGRMLGGQAAAGQGKNGAGFLNGEVVSKDGTSITLKLQNTPGQANGQTGSKIVFYSASTTVSKMASGSIDDLAPGTNVMVIGQTGTDGSVTAQSIQIRPDGSLGILRQDRPQNPPADGEAPNPAQ